MNNLVLKYAKELVFTSVRVQQLMEKAIEKWKEIPDNLCFDEVVSLFTDYGFKWR